MTAALEFVAALAALVLTISYRIENRRRDRLYGVPDPSAPVDTTELADKVRSPPVLQCVPILISFCRLPISATLPDSSAARDTAPLLYFM